MASLIAKMHIEFLLLYKIILSVSKTNRFHSSPNLISQKDIRITCEFKKQAKAVNG